MAQSGGQGVRIGLSVVVMTLKDRQAVVLTLVSSVATGYIQLRELDSRLEAARRARASREEAQREIARKIAAKAGEA